MSGKPNDRAKRRFLAHYRRYGAVGKAGEYAGVSRRTASRYTAEIRAEVESEAAETRAMVGDLVREAGASLLLDLAPGDGSGCETPEAVRWNIVHQGTRTLGHAEPDKLDVAVSRPQVTFALPPGAVPPPGARVEVAQADEPGHVGNGARLLT